MPPPKLLKQASPVEEFLQKSVAWTRGHQEQFWGILGAIALGIAAIIFAIHHRSYENQVAWTQLGVAQSQLMQNQYDTAKKTLAEWNTRYHGTSATSYAKFLQADLLYRSTDYAGAAAVYHDLAQSARPEIDRPLALAAESSAEEMAGHYPQALAAAQAFTDKYPDHFMAASVYMSQARLNELTNNPAAAAALYDRITLLYPQSPWTALAKARQQALGGTTLPKTAAPAASLPMPAATPGAH